MLCQECQKILAGQANLLHPFAGTNPGKPLFYHHPFAYLIEFAAEGGCQICKILWDRLSDAERELVRQTKNQRLPFHPLGVVRGLARPDLSFYGWTIVKVDYNSSCQVRFQFGSWGSKIIDLFFLPANYTLEFKVLGEIHKLASIEDLVADRPVTESMESPSNWDLIQSWVNSCNDQHLGCNTPTILATSEVPSRLIDVRAGDTSQEIRLSLSPEERALLPYVTLSYTWGPEPCLDKLPLLRKDTLEAFSRGISFSSLPRLFQDAVEATRRLKYRYLWIDALCIIQDDTLDWQREAADMGQIYQNSNLNIAAGGAKNSHSPLLGERDASLVRACKVELNWPKISSRISSFYDRKEVRGSFYVVGKDFLQENLLQTPLNRRAWVMQERMLSPRLIHFGKHQLIWRCCNHTACETFPKGLPGAAGTAAFSESTYGVDFQFFEVTKGLREDLWFNVIERYTTCGITRDSDKLIALSGIARNFAEKVRETGDAYIAGLWQSKLIPSLLWLVLDGKQGDGSPSQRSAVDESTVYVAPSWSWASVRGKITHVFQDFITYERYNNYSPLIDVLEIHALPTNKENPYGQVQECYIRLRGTLLSSRRFFWTRYGLLETQSEKKYNVVFAFTGIFSNAVACIIDDMNDFKPRETFLPSVPGLLSPPDVYFLPLVWRPNGDWTGIADLEGLLVARTTGRDNEYRRIGYFKSHKRGGNISAFLRREHSEIFLV